jgi:menaquinone-dependent protoporphyrinogen oxidase
MAGSDASYVDWMRVKGAVVGASLHGGRHQRAAEAFVKAHASQLNAHPSAFFSVSLSAASRNPDELEAVKRLARSFPTPLAWRPGMIVCFAGRLAYTKYGFLKRFLMKRIARKEGASTDTSRDHEFTKWSDVEQFAADMALLIERTSGQISHRTAA